MSAHDPFIRLNLLFSEDGSHRSSPLYLLPEKVTEIVNGKLWVGTSSFVVSEKAEQIRDLVITKLAENRQAETMGHA